MKLDVPKIVKKMDLGGYAAELSGQGVDVWVNPPRGLLMSLTQRPEAETVLAVLAELWSQGPVVESHWTREDLMALIEGTVETDPGLFAWMRDKTFEMIGEHRRTAKKA